MAQVRAADTVVEIGLASDFNKSPFERGRGDSNRTGQNGAVPEPPWQARLTVIRRMY